MSDRVEKLAQYFKALADKVKKQQGKQLDKDTLLKLHILDTTGNAGK